MRVPLNELDAYASKNGWLRLCQSDEDVAYLLPDGSTISADFDQDRFLTELEDSTDCTVDIRE